MQRLSQSIFKHLINTLKSERGCFGGGGGSFSPAPAPPVEPPPPPAPAPVPVETAPQLTAQERRKRIAAMRYGMLSTIKTSPQGITEEGSGKKYLGS